MAPPERDAKTGQATRGNLLTEESYRRVFLPILLAICGVVIFLLWRRTIGLSRITDAAQSVLVISITAVFVADTILALTGVKGSGAGRFYSKALDLAPGVAALALCGAYFRYRYFSNSELVAMFCFMWLLFLPVTLSRYRMQRNNRPGGPVQ